MSLLLLQLEFLHLGEEPHEIHFSSRLWDFISFSAVTGHELTLREVELVVMAASQSPVLRRLEVCLTAAQMATVFLESPSLSQVNRCTRESWDFSQDNLEKPQRDEVLDACRHFDGLKSITLGAPTPPAEMIALFRVNPGIEQLDKSTREAWYFTHLPLLEFEINIIVKAALQASETLPSLKSVHCEMSLPQFLSVLANPNLQRVNESTRESWDLSEYELGPADITAVVTAIADDRLNPCRSLTQILIHEADETLALAKEACKALEYHVEVVGPP